VITGKPGGEGAWQEKPIDKGVDGFARKSTEEPIAIVPEVQEGFHGENALVVYVHQGRRRLLLKGQIFHQPKEAEYWHTLSERIYDSCVYKEGQEAMVQFREHARVVPHLLKGLLILSSTCHDRTAERIRKELRRQASAQRSHILGQKPESGIH
jgi:hypothetical protein